MPPFLDSRCRVLPDTAITNVEIYECWKLTVSPSAAVGLTPTNEAV
ncbi:MAG: hypothetical protein KHY96_05615 [Lachnospiraceae bacterium]|nr:hypothetical protein [Lachnospiraceae bacterium]